MSGATIVFLGAILLAILYFIMDRMDHIDQRVARLERQMRSSGK